MAINLENKKQFFIIVLAVLLGVVAAYLMSEYVKATILQQTRLLAQEYDKKAKADREALMQEVAARQRDMEKKFAEIARQQQAQMATGGTNQGLSSTAFSLKTPPGKRAYTITIDPLLAVGGLLNPGDFVDVLAQINTGENPAANDPNHKLTTMLFQNVQVLAINTIFEPTPNAAQYDLQQKSRALSVTLALSPEEVGLITFVQDKGRLQLSLRSPAEQDTHTVQVASWQTLADYVLEHQGAELDLPRSKGVSAVGGKEEEAEPVIQIYRGGQKL